MCVVVGGGGESADRRPCLRVAAAGGAEGGCLASAGLTFFFRDAEPGMTPVSPTGFEPELRSVGWEKKIGFSATRDFAIPSGACSCIAHKRQKQLAWCRVMAFDASRSRQGMSTERMRTRGGLGRKLAQHRSCNVHNTTEE